MQDLGRQVAGEHQFDLNIAELVSGMYTYTLTRRSRACYTQDDHQVRD